MDLQTVYASFVRMLLTPAGRQTLGGLATGVGTARVYLDGTPGVHWDGVPVDASPIALTTAAFLTGRVPACEGDKDLVDAAEHFFRHLLQRSPGDGRPFSCADAEPEASRIVNELQNAGVDLRWNAPPGL
jgi:hypothetical protein